MKSPAAAIGPPAPRRSGLPLWSFRVLFLLFFSSLLIITILSSRTNGKGWRVSSTLRFFRKLSRGAVKRAWEGGISKGSVTSGPALIGVPIPGRGTRDDPDPIHIVYTVCGNPNEIERDLFGLLNLKSLLMAKEHNAGSERHYHFHIITNVPEQELFNTTRLNYEVWRKLVKEGITGHSSFSVIQIKELDDAVVRVLGVDRPNLEVPHHIFKNCAASRVKLPFLLGGKVDRILYMDWDTVAMCDLTGLWEQWAHFSKEQILGFARFDPSGVSPRDIYREWKLDSPADGAVNSGVMLMHIGKMHADNFRVAREWWAGNAAIIRSRANVTGDLAADYWQLTKAFPLGDQDIFNALLKKRPEWLYYFPFHYNWCIDPPFFEDMSPEDKVNKRADYTEHPVPCVIHFCGNK